MRSDATDVTSYVAEQPDDWRPTVKKLRAACRRHLVGYREVMAYGMPSYRRTDGDEVEVAFAKQARYLSLYITKQPVLDTHRAQLAGLEVGKGCIRYRRPEQIDWDVVHALLDASASSDAPIC